MTVDETITYLQDNPDARPPSGDYCFTCMWAGMAHCPEPSRVGEPSGCGQRVAFEDPK